MNSDYKVGDLIYDANIYDAMNTNLDDWYFYKRWLPENKDARILELCCGTGRLTLPIAKEGYDITGIDYTPSMLAQAKLKLRSRIRNKFYRGRYQNFEFAGKIRLYLYSV